MDILVEDIEHLKELAKEGAAGFRLTKEQFNNLIK